MSFLQQKQPFRPSNPSANTYKNAQKMVDYNQTYSFDALPQTIFDSREERPFKKLHRELNESLSKINKLRQQTDQESQDISKIRQFLIKLNTIVHDNHRTMKELRMNNEFSINADTVKEMLQKHNHILKQQIEFLQSIPNCAENSKATAKLNQRIATLQKEIKEEKDNISEPVNQGSREETSTLKKKVKYLKREHDELEEFIKKEIEFEREEDDKTIKELNETITNLTNEIQQTKERLNKSKSSQFASEYAEVTRRVKLAKQKIAQSNHDIISLRAENEKLAASIEIEKESTHRLEKERDTLQKLIRSIKESTV